MSARYVDPVRISSSINTETVRSRPHPFTTAFRVPCTQDRMQTALPAPISWHLYITAYVWAVLINSQQHWAAQRVLSTITRRDFRWMSVVCVTRATSSLSCTKHAPGVILCLTAACSTKPYTAFVHFEFVQCFCGQYPSNLKGFFRASQIHHIGLRSCFLISKNLVF